MQFGDARGVSESGGTAEFPPGSVRFRSRIPTCLSSLAPSGACRLASKGGALPPIGLCPRFVGQFPCTLLRCPLFAAPHAGNSCLPSGKDGRTAPPTDSNEHTRSRAERLREQKSAPRSTLYANMAWVLMMKRREPIGGVRFISAAPDPPGVVKAILFLVCLAVVASCSERNRVERVAVDKVHRDSFVARSHWLALVRRAGWQGADVRRVAVWWARCARRCSHHAGTRCLANAGRLAMSCGICDFNFWVG